MADLVIRSLVAGEEELFDSMPDPLQQLRQAGYADGTAGGGYRPEHTWVALLVGRVVGRAAWLLPPGSVGTPGWNGSTWVRCRRNSPCREMVPRRDSRRAGGRWRGARRWRT
ncbi:hypothetical protein [Micromonospora sp. LOL_024]|uniref:hypothetical protein n=1 Tax=Micromonospora sp. LOL_024 TaxID=3345412 RepID=UPI003A876FC1